MPVEEHTLFSAKSAATFLDCGYTMCGQYGDSFSVSGGWMFNPLLYISRGCFGQRSAGHCHPERHQCWRHTRTAIAGQWKGGKQNIDHQECNSPQKKMAPTAGALIAGITRFVETPEDIKRAVDELADLGIDQVSSNPAFTAEKISDIEQTSASSPCLERRLPRCSDQKIQLSRTSWWRLELRCALIMTGCPKIYIYAHIGRPRSWDPRLLTRTLR
jgi:hypothetical protein